MSLKTFLSALLSVWGINMYAQQNNDSTMHFHLIANSNLILSNATLTSNSQIGLEYAFSKRHSVLFTYLIPYNRKDTCDDIMDYALELGYKYRISSFKKHNPMYLKFSITQLKGKLYFSPYVYLGDCVYKKTVNNATIFSLGVSKEYKMNNRIYVGGEFLIGGRYAYQNIITANLFLNMIGALNIKYGIL
jgi:hypothetical protein